MKYEERLKKVIDFIGAHLDEPLTLEQLSRIACLSPFHFHRLFAGYTGLSLQQYIRWLRLRRAAYQLSIYKDRPIIEIAIDAGFESHEAFTRAFKRSCGMSPKAFKTSQEWDLWREPPYCLPRKEDMTMNVEIRNIDARRLAVMEHRGDVNKLIGTLNALIDWAKAQPIDLKPKAGNAFGFAYDDPAVTPPAEFRFDLGLEVPENFKLDENVIEKRLPAGRYAVALHKGSRDHIAETVYGLYRDWLPKSDEELGDLPCIFSYLNFDYDVAETEALTECWLLLK